MHAEQHVNVGRGLLVGAVATAALASLAADTVRAETYTWTRGSGTSNNWSLAANWDKGVPPLDATDTDLLFTGSPGSTTSTQNTGDITLRSVTFDSGLSLSGNLSLSTASGNTQNITLGSGGLTQRSPHGVTLTTGSGTAPVKLTLSADQTWTNTNSLVSNINLTVNRLIYGNGRVTKTGPGLVTLNADNSNWTGGLELADGPLRLSGHANAAGAGPLIVNTANDVSITASGNTEVNQVIAGPVSIGGTGLLTLGGSWAFTFNNTVTLTSDKRLSVSRPTAFNNAIVGAFELTKAGGQPLTLNAASPAFTGDLTITGGSVLARANGALGTGNVTVVGAATLDLGAGLTNAIPDWATLSLDPNEPGDAFGKLALTAGVNETVGGLLLDGVAQADGTYGATGSGAQFVNDTYFSGTGVLTVAAVPEPTALLPFALAAAAAHRRRRRPYES